MPRKLRRAPAVFRPDTTADRAPHTDGGRGAESPLLWMHRRKDADGAPLIGDAAFAAGERLRADLTLAGMLPKVTMDWSNAARVDRSGLRERLNPSEAAIAARQRADLALRTVGPELSGLLIDLCGFGKGLELIERERQWPARSGKIVAKLALAALARHYGFGDVALGRGRVRSRGWIAPGARPKVTDAPFAAREQSR
jgi:hypothetical protein